MLPDQQEDEKLKGVDKKKPKYVLYTNNPNLMFFTSNWGRISPGIDLYHVF